MEQIFEKLGEFMRSPLCIFDFGVTDYPTQFQQHLITSYFSLSQLLQNQSTDDIVRLFHSSDKSLQVFVPGVLYEMLLNPASAQGHFQTYMPSLRSQSWTHFGRLMLNLLRDSFLWIKQQFRAGVIPSLEKLFFYGQLEGDLVVLAVKTIDYTDLSQGALNYNNELLCFFHRLLSEPGDSPFSYILAKTLFYKIFRMLALLACLEDQALRDYKLRLVLVAQKLFELERQKCLYIANSGINVLRQAQKQELLVPLSAQLLEALRVWEATAEAPQSAATRLSAVLPLRVETALLYIMREKPSRLQIKVQLEWVFGNSPEYSALLVMDILRYLLALPAEQFPMREGLIILQWLFYRVAPNNLLAELWKDELFYPCFAEHRPFPSAPERALRFTSHLLQTDPDLGQTLIIYLLHHYGQHHGSALRVLLMQANELDILRIDDLLNGQILRGRTKQELQGILGHSVTPSLNRGVSNNSEPLYYDPLESMNRKQSQMSMEFSNSEESLQYAQNQSEEQMRPQIQITAKQNELSESTARVKLQKMFVEDLGSSLTDLMANPSLPLYKDFLKQFVQLLKEMRVGGQSTHSDSFVSEAAKVTYLMFQNQFEEHKNITPKEENVVLELLSCVASEWRTRGLQLDTYKKIIKRIGELFPTAQPVFWRLFLLNFRRSTFGACKQMREWLISKEQAGYALALLSELGPVNREMIENGQQLRLAYP